MPRILTLLLLCLAACTPVRTLSSTVHVERVETDQFLVALEIRDGLEVLATPKVLCNADEPATIELKQAERGLHILVTPPPPDGEAGVDVTVCVSEAGAADRTQRIIVPVGSSGTVTCRAY